MKRTMIVFLSLVLAFCMAAPAMAQITAEEWTMPIVEEKINLTG